MGSRYLLLMLVLGAVLSSYSVEGWFGKVKKYVRDFAGGSRDMWRNYNDMKKANTRGADKYFHAKGNYEAAKRGTGGRHASAVISNAREAAQLAKGLFQRKPVKDLVKDMRADQKANKWGRSGGDPNKFRPRGLDKKYKK